MSFAELPTPPSRFPIVQVELSASAGSRRLWAMGAGMCKDVVSGRGGSCPESGGYKDSVTMERILHRKTQAIQGSNISSRQNGTSLKSPSDLSNLPPPKGERGDPPVRPPRKKDRLRKPPLPRRNQSAATLSASPEATAADLEVYLKRCHSMGAVPALLEELHRSRQASSASSSLVSTLDEAIPQDRLPSFASVTPPPSPSSPGESYNNAPHFFIGSRNRSPTSDATSYVDLWTSGKAKGPLIGRDEDGMQDLIRKLRRVRSQGDRRGDHGVGALTEHVIDILPTKCAGPPKLSVNRSSSTPHLAQIPSSNVDEDRNNPRTILLKILGQYHCLPGSGGLARKGKKGEEDDLRAIEKQLDATWGHLRRSNSRAEGKGDEDDNSSVTPSLGELEEALAQMLEEDDWEEREEERAAKEREEVEREEKEESVMRMKRENTFTALSDLSKNELLE